MKNKDENSNQERKKQIEKYAITFIENEFDKGSISKNLIEIYDNLSLYIPNIGVIETFEALNSSLELGMVFTEEYNPINGPSWIIISNDNNDKNNMIKEILNDSSKNGLGFDGFEKIKSIANMIEKKGLSNKNEINLNIKDQDKIKKISESINNGFNEFNDIIKNNGIFIFNQNEEIFECIRMIKSDLEDLNIRFQSIIMNKK